MTSLPVNFIQNIISDDRANGMTHIHTRFPPEPNGYLHIGHAKSICLNFGLAIANGGLCNLRFDDTNPVKEDTEYVDAIMADIKWLGFTWHGEPHYASDYFDTFYEGALALIRAGKAFVCDLSAEEMRAYRGTLTEPGKESPYRNRSIEENLALFDQMKNGDFPDGTRVLRAKIDMASGNVNMRDPVLYRIMHADHHRTGSNWCIYPMYDYAHPLSDAIEGITHSVCTLEFEDHRPLYDWCIDQLIDEIHFPSRPRQIEFARLVIQNTVTSKRKLKKLVDEGLVDGWDDPRMPTLSGLRRRGYTPAAIRDFCDRIGVAKTNSIVDPALLEHCLREDLNMHAPRAMAVLRPLKLTISNYPEGEREMLPAQINPNNPEAGDYALPFSKHLYIEQEDFREEANKKYHRLKPGAEVRLKYGYIIRCEDFIKDPETGAVIEVICSYDPLSKSGGENSGRKVKGTLHWVEAETAIDAEVRLYGQMLTEEEGEDVFNAASLQILPNAKLEPRLQEAVGESAYQFLRNGYYCLDAKASSGDQLVFHEIVGLKGSYQVES